MKNIDSLYEQGRKKRITREFAILIFSVSAFYALILTPVYSWTSSDVLIAKTGIPVAIEALLDICNFCFYWIAFGYLLWLSARFSLRACRALALLYFAATLFRYGAALLAGYFLNGFPTFADFASDALPYLTADILLDLAFVGVAALLIYFIFEIPNAARRKTAQELRSPLSAYLPFAGLLEMKNRLLRVSLIVSAIPSVVQIVYRVIYDVTFYGAPRNLPDLLWMITYYLMDLISIVIGFFVIVLFLNRAYFREEKALMEYDA
ncbi:MAG: hypothetical protein IIX80_01645 [Clostridia bacterium]|nr:hypothetical protein [Clostridia bacterium]